MTTTSTTVEQIHELGRRWVEAEQAGDVAVLDALSTPDFTLDGPLGFVLDKAQWLDRYRSGDMATHTLAWEQVEVRDYGEAAVAVGVHDQTASYRGNRVDGRFRATQILVRDPAGRRRLAGVHLSPIGAPPPAAGVLISEGARR